jgi:hypothetical protein
MVVKSAVGLVENLVELTAGPKVHLKAENSVVLKAAQTVDQMAAHWVR